MEGLTRWVNSTDWLSRPADKLPYPATWLNGQRWNDLPSAVAKPLKPEECASAKPPTPNVRRRRSERFVELAKKHPGKSQAEIAEIMNRKESQNG